MNRLPTRVLVPAGLASTIEANKYHQVNYVLDATQREGRVDVGYQVTGSS